MRSPRPRRVLPSILAATVLLAAGSVHAVAYGDFEGANVRFEGVQDQSGLYGAPIVSGDSLDFSPNAFEVGCPAASCAGGTASVQDQLSFVVQTKAHARGLSSIRLQEAGDTTLASFTGGLASSRVSAVVRVDVLAVDGIAVNGIQSQVDFVFTPDGSFATAGPGSQTLIWQGLVDIDLDAVLAEHGAEGLVTRVGVSVDNVLTVEAGDGSFARIEKKDFGGIGVAASVVPEPGAALLYGLAIGVLSTVRGRSVRSPRRPLD